VTIVSLIRHGSTRWNEEGRIQGRHDIPLSERGRAQVRAWRLPVEPSGAASTPRLISSPLARATETAEILFGAAPAIERSLIEMDWGAWEGSTLAELHERFGAGFERNQALGLDFRPPRGESPRDVQARVMAWLVPIAADRIPVLAVTHLGVLRAVLAAATGWDMTTKPPIRLKSDTLHRFSVSDEGVVAVVACNVALTPASRAPPQ